MTAQGVTSLPAWTTLADHARIMADRPMGALFVEDKKRFEHFSRRVGPLLVDYSKHRIIDQTMSHLMALARARNVEAIPTLARTALRLFLHLQGAYKNPFNFLDHLRIILRGIP